MGLIGWVGVGLGGTCACRCGILHVPMLGVIFCAGFVSLTSSAYPSPLFVGTIVLGGVFFGLPPGFCYVCVCVGLARLFSVEEKTGV